MRPQKVAAWLCVALTTAGLGSLSLCAAGTAPQAGQPSAASAQTQAPVSARTWLDQRQAIEEYLRTAEIVSMKEIPVGVTRPTRCQFAPGGLVAEMAWKPIPPGRPSGFWESYKSEIAAYELDKLLGLDMVPPTVEKRVKGDLGAAVMWVSPTKNFKELGGAPTAPANHLARWNRQLSRAKMFDNLIANIDPNLGNWLVDPAWNLILIDHTRAFTTTKDLFHKMQRIDAELWEKMQLLTEARLQEVLGPWVGQREIRTIIERRDKMAQEIARMVAASSESAVFIR
jgi:hypothetical protein